MSASLDFAVDADAGLIAEAFDVASVEIGGGAEDLWIVRDVAVGERRHDATGTGDGDANADFGADGDGAADPVIFGEGDGNFGIDDEVGAEALDGEVAIGIGGGEGTEGGGADDVDASVIEESARLAAGGGRERVFEGRRREGKLQGRGGGGKESDIGAEGGAELLRGHRSVIGGGDVQSAIGIEASVPEEQVRELADF